MARKKAEKKPKRPDVPGRFIEGYGHEGTQWEQVRVTVTAEQLVKDRARIADLDVKGREQADAAAIAKNKLRDIKRERDELAEGIVHGFRENSQPVFRFADDDAGTVKQYHADTHEYLGEREIEDDDRQESMDLSAGEESEDE